MASETNPLRYSDELCQAIREHFGDDSEVAHLPADGSDMLYGALVALADTMSHAERRACKLRALTDKTYEELKDWRTAELRRLASRTSLHVAAGDDCRLYKSGQRTSI